MKRILLSLLLLTTACNPLVPQKAVPPTAPSNYSVAATAGQEQLPERWWTVFSDEQLNRLENELFAQNLDLRQSLARLEQLDAQLQSAGASLWPTLGLSASAARSRTAAGVYSGATSVSLAAGYEVDLWNRLHDQESAARMRRAAGAAQTRTLLLSLSAQLAEQYFIAIEQRNQLTLLERQIEHYHQLLEIVTERYRGGLAVADELYHARQNLAAARARVPAYRNALAQAQNAIALLLGQAPGTLEIAADRLPEPLPLVAIGLPGDLLTRRPDITAALRTLDAADHSLAAAVAERLPALDLSASLGRSLTHLTAGNVEGTFWTLVLGLSQPLLDGGRREAEIRRQTAIRNEALAAAEQAILTALQDVENALSSERATREQGVLIDDQQQIILQRLELARENYRAGLSDSRDLLDNEISYLNILTQQISNRRQWLSNRISLARALGGSWMEEELKRRTDSKTPQ
ncbi:MAG: hypothetical protein C0622_08050 [Desulfuromonas sp.]|nr:MAG: hypothetical protein C0622_08050 [Desulfuromonas sp.]